MNERPICEKCQRSLTRNGRRGESQRWRCLGCGGSQFIGGPGAAEHDDEFRPDCRECGTPMRRHRRQKTGWQYRCVPCERYETVNPDQPKEENEQPEAHPGYDTAAAAARNKAVKGKKRYVITSAQNNSHVHPIFKTLLKFCELNDAELLIVPVHYKNISLYTAGNEYKKWWEEELWPYMVDGEIQLTRDLVVRADLKINATTLHPLRGKGAINGRKWTVFGHPQHAMQPVAATQDMTPKRTYSTGSITRKNYSQTDLGARAEFHHITGALIVELVRGRPPFVRQINADPDGNFYDLDYFYTPEGREPAPEVLSVTFGDLHELFLDPSVRKATFEGPESILGRLKPQHLVFHDIIDAYTVSHHHERDDVVKYRKHHTGMNNARMELDRVVEFLNSTVPRDSVAVIVPSNHHRHFYRWLQEADYRRDPVNADLILELKAKQYQNSLAGETTDPFEIYVRPRLTCNHVFVKDTESFLLGGVDHGQHGDLGPNGSRGSLNAFAALALKRTIGHGHGAGIQGGVFRVGTSTGHLEYERGLSDHGNTHAVQYLNGKRTLVDLFGGRWHGQAPR